MLTLIWVIFVHAIAFVPGESSHMHVVHQRRLADDTVDRQGYISIDCGTDELDSTTGITYKPDSEFINTGINKKISSEFMLSGSGFIFNTIRIFPDGDRNCYTLRPSSGKGNKYLIRAHFMYGNYDGNNTITVFDLYIGVNFWKTVNLSTVTEQRFHEIVHQPTTESIDICLVNTGNGTPFISALVLRPLNNSIYNTSMGSLATKTRYVTGLFADNVFDNHYTSYRDDMYDRFWSSLPSNFNTNWQSFTDINEFTPLTNDAYKVPPSILKMGARPIPSKRSLLFSHKPNDPQTVSYVYWHFAETEKLRDNETREFEIFVNDYLQGAPIRPNFSQSLTIASKSITLGPGESRFHFSINQTNASKLPPFLNAVEIYDLLELPQSTTNQDDVNAITNIKTMYGSMNDWQGDPCLPVSPWDGLKCSDNNTNSPRITQLNLASRGLIGQLSPSIYSLTSLNYLNLSYNNLNGTIPEFLANMPSLQVIDLRGNKFSGTVPIKLTNKVKNGSLSLSLDDNPDLCTSDSDSCSNKRKKHKILVPVVGSTSLFVLLIVVATYCAFRWKKKQGYTNGNKSKGGMNSKSREFTYSEVVNMTNNFQTIIGKGAFGTVYHGSLEDGSAVAVKILNHSSSSLHLKSFQTEAELLTRVHHRNLVSLVGYCDDDGTMSLIYEYMANGNLQEQLAGDNTQIISWTERLKISIDAAQGLDYLHNGCKPAIIHRDLKPANILLDYKLQAKIADFGLSRIFATESATHISTEHMVGTPGYLDPELHASFLLNEKSDVYGFGVILLELITGQTAMIKIHEHIVHIVDQVTPYLVRGDIHNIVDKRLSADYDTNSAWKALETAMACVSSSGYQRPSMDQVLVDLKECLARELASKKVTKGTEPKLYSSNQNFDGICVDSEVNIGPSAR